MDKLSDILRRFSIRAGVFYSGQLCGLSAFEQDHGWLGHIHLLRQGRLRLQESGQAPLDITEPSLLFYPQPTAHRISADASAQAEIVCASVHYGTGAANPVSAALPHLLVLPLKQNPRVQHAAEGLFDEAFADRDAKHIMMDRMAEILVVELLRHLLDRGDVATGMLAGLSHPQLSQALNAIHHAPEHPWTLQELASLATMSRSKFADVFRQVVGNPAGDYVIEYRLELAKCLLRQGKPVGWVAHEVGYETASALARVFRKKLGVSPMAWLNEQPHARAEHHE